MHCVLLKWHPMIGLDFHDEITSSGRMPIGLAERAVMLSVAR